MFAISKKKKKTFKNFSEKKKKTLFKKSWKQNRLFKNKKFNFTSKSIKN